MMESDKGLMVYMLGSFEMYYDGIPVRFNKKLTSKPILLLLLLLYNRKHGVSRQSVIEALFGQESEVDTYNNLNATVSQLRRILKETHLPRENYIHVRLDRYYFDSSFLTWVDTEEAKALRHEADIAEGNRRMELLYKICELYHGRFMPELDGELWAEIAAADCQRLYRESLNEICCVLREQGAFNEIFRMTDVASKKFPFDEWQVWQQEALLLQGRIREAHELYRQVEKLYRTELDAPPPERIRSRFRMPVKEPWRHTESTSAVRKWLCDANQSGPCCIPLPSFSYVYDLVAKQSSITDTPFCLLLCTVYTSDGRTRPVTAEFYGVMEKLESVLKESLRWEDVFTNYTRGQYLALLPGASPEIGSAIMADIETRFQSVTGDRKLLLNCELMQSAQLTILRKKEEI